MSVPTPRARAARPLLIWGLSAWIAATAATGEDGGRPTLRFRRLTTYDGLSDSTVEAILQDHRGFMWFGTADGLNRHDGYSFRVYRPEKDDPTSLGGAYVWDLFEDREGVLWISTSYGLSRYVRETDSFVRYLHDPEDATSLSHNTVLDVLEDSHGTLWVATSGGLHRLDRTRGTFFRYEHDEADPGSISHNNVQVIHEDSLGRLWVGTQAGLNRYDRESDRFLRYRHDPEDKTSLSHNYIRDICEDRQGHLWVGTENGLNRLPPEEPAHFIRYRYDPQDPDSPILDNQIWTVFEDSQATLWVGTDRGGLAFLDRMRDAFVHYTHDPRDDSTIGSNIVSIIYEDASGDIWTGNYAGGVNFLDRRSTTFALYRSDPADPATLNHPSVLAFLEDASGGLWVGTEQGLASFERSTGRFVRYRHDPTDPFSLSAPAVLSIHQDREGAMWVGTYNGGLNRFDPAQGRFVRQHLEQEDDPSAEKAQIWSIEDDHAGYLWIATSAGLYRMDRASGATVLYRNDEDDATSVGHDVIWDLHEDRDGRLWIATHGGLSLYDRERDAFDTYRHEPADGSSLSHNEIMSLHEAGDGRLWVGTHGGGLNLFDPRERSFVHYRRADGLPSDAVLCVVGDAAGDIWVGTNRGLSRYRPVENTFSSFDHNDGLQGLQFNRRACLRTSSGELLFGGLEGLNVFDPASLEINSAVPPVVITDFRVFDRSATVGESEALQKSITEAEIIRLDHDQSVLSFSFAALNYRNPWRNEYAYMLVGFDDDWVHAGSRRTVTYTNLDPGEYTLRVRGANNDGVWNEQGAAVRLRIAPPVWATWWFRLVSLVLFCALVVVAYRVRVQAIAKQVALAERLRVAEERQRLIGEVEAKNLLLEQQNEELERFAYTVSHDLKSPLVTIRGFLGLLEKDAQAGDLEGVLRDIDRIGGAAETMTRLLGEVLELSRIGRIANPAQEIPLTALAVEAAQLLAGPIKARGVEIDIEPRMPTVVGDRVRLLEVFQNLISNSVSYMGAQSAPSVKIGGRQDDGEVVCFVRDNGVGIDAAHHEKIFGLFERLDPSTEGTGVGLALVKRIIEVHDGRIWVESDGPGTGATFWFTLPRNGTAQRTARS